MTKFINPYTFVPIENKNPDRKNPREAEGTLSGCLKCSLDVLSPTFVPNTSNDFCENEHKRQVFFSYCDLSGEQYSDEIRHPEKPIIPGSEIRGMIRNVYEQLTNSCFLHIDENNFPYKRTNVPKKLCIMKYDHGTWKLYKAEEKKDYYKKALIENEEGGIDVDHGWGYPVKETREKDRILNEYVTQPYQRLYEIFKDCHKVSIKNINADYPDATFDKNGEWYVHIPELFSIKNAQKVTANRQIIYTDRYIKNGVEITAANLERFERVIGDTVKGGYLYGAPASNAYKMYWKRYQNKEPLIVYVDEESYTKGFHNDVIYMSCSSITKEFFSNTIPAILESDHQHQPCTTKDSACPACRMFGMIGEDGGNKGKLRFTDGVVTSLPEYANEITLQILGSPRISSTEFYLKKPSDRATMWNYDYYQEGNKRKEYMPTLSGRKVYWNRTYAKEADQADNMNVTVTPIKKARFDFSVYFDKLTAEELHNLMFCLQLSKDANHKIGHGKPLGLGKVKIDINQAILKNYEKIDHLIKVNYTSVDLESADAEIARIAQTPAARAILKYSRELSNGDGALVDYPKASKGGKTTIFNWFVANRGPIKNPSIKDTLPNIMDVNQELPVHEDNRQNSKSDHRNRRK